MKLIKSFTTLSHASHAVNDIYWFVIPSVLPVILDEFKLGYGWAGGILTAFLLTIAVFSLIFGHFSDRFSRWSIISLGFLLASVGFFLSGFSHTEGTLIATLLLAAVGVVPIIPCMQPLMKTPGKKKVKFMGFEFWGVVNFRVFFIFGSLLQMVDWRGIFFLTVSWSLVGFSLHSKANNSQTGQFRVIRYNPKHENSSWFFP